MVLLASLKHLHHHHSPLNAPNLNTPVRFDFDSSSRLRFRDNVNGGWNGGNASRGSSRSRLGGSEREFSREREREGQGEREKVSTTTGRIMEAYKNRKKVQVMGETGGSKSPYGGLASDDPLSLTTSPKHSTFDDTNEKLRRPINPSNTHYVPYSPYRTHHLLLSAKFWKLTSYRQELFWGALVDVSLLLEDPKTDGVTLASPPPTPRQRKEGEEPPPHPSSIITLKSRVRIREVMTDILPVGRARTETEPSSTNTTDTLATTKTSGIGKLTRKLSGGLGVAAGGSSTSISSVSVEGRRTDAYGGIVVIRQTTTMIAWSFKFTERLGDGNLLQELRKELGVLKDDKDRIGTPTTAKLTSTPTPPSSLSKPLKSSHLLHL
ncbi:hypothetical protein BDN72DRAFT_936120 [Pluteus cervinus]|uniref:Uncharacterized protein n=1 Tax=Pluteus cervinus TaxID=181527 RepID=A0ACD3A6Y6_9AGAR|nr:hypothetical protein BDN72DRAFT_936120 [Pluteus cervinus]